MAYAPVKLSDTPLEDYGGYWLKFYEQGTTTPLSMATDVAAGTLLVKAEISSGGTVPIGFVKTAGDAQFIPFINGDYDCWLFPTEAEADANDTTNAIQVADNLNTDGNAAFLANTADAAKGDAGVGVIRSESNATETTQHLVNQARSILADEDFGLVAGDSSTAVRDANDTAIANIVADSGGQKVQFPKGDYYFNSGILIDKQCNWEGLGASLTGTGTQPVIFYFPQDINGIEIQHFDLATPNNAAGSAVENIAVIAEAKNVSGTGIKMYAGRAIIRNCLASGFKEHGFDLSSGTVNINVFRLEYCTAVSNDLDGLFLDGPDANAGTIISFDSRSNGRWGIYDSSFLGNTYVGCHVSTNGIKKTITGATQANPCVITTSGDHGFETGKSIYIENIVGMTEINNAFYTVTVLTSTTFSLDAEDSSAYTAYSSAGNAYYGGSYRTDNVNARNMLLGCYSESGYAPSNLVAPTMVVGGAHLAGRTFSSNPLSFGATTSGFSNSLTEYVNFHEDLTYTITAGVGGNDNTGKISTLESSDDGQPFRFKYIEASNYWRQDWANSGGFVQFGFFNGANPNFKSNDRAHYFLPRGHFIGLPTSMIDKPRDIQGTGSPNGVWIGEIGSTFRRTDGGAGTSFYVKEALNTSAISAATQANPVVVTTGTHGFSNGDEVYIKDVVGMTELNGLTFTIANVTGTTFELSGVDGTGYTAYSSGGNSYDSRGWVAK